MYPFGSRFGRSYNPSQHSTTKPNQTKPAQPTIGPVVELHHKLVNAEYDGDETSKQDATKRAWSPINCVWFPKTQVTTQLFFKVAF